MKNGIKTVVFYILLIAVLLTVVTFLFEKTSDPEKLVYSDIVDCFRNEEVRSFNIDDKNNITLTLDDETVIEYKLRSLDIFLYDVGDLIEEQHEAGIIEEYNYDAPVTPSLFMSYLPYIVILVFIVIIYFVMLNQTMGGKGGRINSFGRSRAHVSDNKNPVHFSDVAGADEEKEELEEVVEFLKNPDRYRELGARIPRGVLLVGPPGTGKTLLAKAVAGEAGVPFYSISGSDFVEMYVGVGASRVRDLFENAKKNSPSIVFIDEIDAVGRHRGAGLGGGHDEREQTLNQLLVEMDGFGSNDGVIVIAATNRPDILDPALLRPGRFDRQVTVNYPDLQGRIDILKVHAKGKPFEEAVELEKIAQTTVGFTGADLANLLNEAALHAARHHKKLIGMSDIEEASLKIMVGTQKKNKKFKPEEKRKTAFHEAGHAVIAHILPSVDPVRQISIIPSGRALGYTLTVPLEDKVSVYKNGLMEEITMILGGRVAEKVFFDDISGGASNDIQRATDIARNMVTRLGMSDTLGPIAFASERSDDEIFLGRDFNNTKNYSEETARLIDIEIKKIIDAAFARAEELIRANEDKMTVTAEYLLKYETMDADQFAFVMNSENVPTIEEIASIAEEKKKKSELENKNAAETRKVFTVKAENSDIPAFLTVSPEEIENNDDIKDPTDNNNGNGPDSGNGSQN